MTWTYINLYTSDSIEWIINFSWILSIIILILTSFLNLLAEIAETFSVILFITLISIPQITLLTTIHNFTQTSITNNSHLSLANLTQYKILVLYHNKDLKWITT